MRRLPQVVRPGLPVSKCLAAFALRGLSTRNILWLGGLGEDGGVCHHDDGPIFPRC